MSQARTSSPRRIELLEAQLAMMVITAKKILSDIDDDGVAERGDMAVMALLYVASGNCRVVSKARRARPLSRALSV